MTKRLLAAAAASALSLAICAPIAAQDAPEPPTPNSVIAEATAEEWRAIDPADLLVMRLSDAPDGSRREVVIQLLPEPFSAGWTQNIRSLAAARFWDGTSVYRVVDNWVAQWGDGEDDKALAKPLPDTLTVVPESDYVTATIRDPEGVRDYVMVPSDNGPRRAEIVINPYIDSYSITGFVDGWPVGLDDEGGRTAWPVHCYASVGVARDLTPNTGTGAELYAVIGHGPRQLDRNIAVVGRVIEGVEHLAMLPRGSGGAGVYAEGEPHTPIEWVRMGDELEAGLYDFEYLDTASETFGKYVSVRANRTDSFYIQPAGGVDLCNIQVPIRRTAG
ncbi:peptidylprolyl isomerase [Paraurantiacibacter namhicola]|uniref:Cyclophilin type peptidyl-prolyl cis-trans isomerase/CLD n=1 Tax=Paraurantiacibacter namhicola TaxID=645517 RepID=A0A1C7D7A5_9SPHN|nr:peptidylprolyl isomerase [Paraurantiacibacter namhicola]ANU07325.1 Cyclophilin type peptidyl-prolyl cis-trans isomerase/CLD [Paraurantiacibacter namhicola]